MIVSIHQPNFMPWYPFFKKVEQADIFVILSHCQYEKGGYQNRFNLDNRWYTMGVDKKTKCIADKKYNNCESDWESIKRRLQEYECKLNDFDSCIQKSLMHTNIEIIRKICNTLNIKTKIVYDEETNLKGTDRLIEICKNYKAKTYIAGPSGKNYLDEKLFEKSDMKIIYQSQKKVDQIPILKVL
tara:strand:- start:1240 stop:1794 length:555 start_codon:yes stop_codon:yes gene_type:complete